MGSKINFQNDFMLGVEVFDTAKALYSQKDYAECLTFLDESLSLLKLTNHYLFADFLSLIGNILWKLSQPDLATRLWEKALIHNIRNRNATLCLSLLSEKKGNYYFCVYVNINMDKYYKENIPEEEIDVEAQYVLLKQYWDEHLQFMDFESMEENDMLDFFSQIEPF